VAPVLIVSGVSGTYWDRWSFVHAWRSGRFGLRNPSPGCTTSVSGPTGSVLV